MWLIIDFESSVQALHACTRLSVLSLLFLSFSFIFWPLQIINVLWSPELVRDGPVDLVGGGVKKEFEESQKGIKHATLWKKKICKAKHQSFSTIYIYQIKIFIIIMVKHI